MDLKFTVDMVIVFWSEVYLAFLAFLAVCYLFPKKF